MTRQTPHSAPQKPEQFDPVLRHRERIRKWSKTPGDLDDFIFHIEEPKEKSDR